MPRLMTPARPYLTPPQLAERWAVSPDKVLAWIKSGELRAINVATSTTGRPRYRVAEADAVAFENRRAARPAPAPRRHHKAAAEVFAYF